MHGNGATKSSYIIICFVFGYMNSATMGQKDPLHSCFIHLAISRIELAIRVQIIIHEAKYFHEANIFS